MRTRRFLLTLCLTAAVAMFGSADTARANAEERAAIDAAADLALSVLYAKNAGAQQLAEKAEAILVFPEITKAGLGIGVQGGKGVLRKGGASADYYKARGVSIGAQAGVQTYGYVLMFMTASAYEDFVSKKGYELGVDGSVAVVNAAVTANVDTASLKSDTVALIFSEQGIMVSLTLEGSKITKLDI
jgi:lipid-binding SYLF domain-containing protein